MKLRFHSNGDNLDPADGEHPPAGTGALEGRRGPSGPVCLFFFGSEHRIRSGESVHRDWRAGSSMGKAMRRFVGAAAAVWAMTMPAMPADILPVLPGPPVAPIVGWTGCYAGGNFEVGLASDNISWVPNQAGFPISAVDLNSTGTANALYMTTNVGGGGQAGCNYQTGAFVWGAEGDFDYTGINGTRSTNSPGRNAPSFGVTETVQSNWLSTIRGRAGLADGPWMLYATGGVAFAQSPVQQLRLLPLRRRRLQRRLKRSGQDRLDGRRRRGVGLCAPLVGQGGVSARQSGKCRLHKHQ